jgi:uncharacterized protein YuzE
MKLHYYPDTDTLYVSLLEGPSVNSDEIADEVVVDYGADGRVVGIEIDHASGKVDLSALEITQSPFVSLRATA